MGLPFAPWVEGKQMALPLFQRLIRMTGDHMRMLMIIEAYRNEVLPMTNDE